jgi:hypothetical protein
MAGVNHMFGGLSSNLCLLQPVLGGIDVGGAAMLSDCKVYPKGGFYLVEFVRSG